jgi:hypothetical protein
MCKDPYGDVGHHAAMLEARASLMAEQVRTVHADADENKMRDVFARTMKEMEALFLSEQRYDRNMANTHIQAWKEGVLAIFKVRRKELLRRLRAGVVVTEGKDLEGMVGDIMDIFSGLHSEKREAADLKVRLGDRLVTPVQRTLGTRTLQATDSDGFKSGPSKSSERFCYDLPVDQTLAVLLQHDERARRQFRAASRRWAAGAGNAVEGEQILFDIPDGLAFKSHPMLGTKSPQVNGFKGAIMLYYDGFEVS